MRVGVLFGGAAREREVSYAGGRTVVDTLDRRYYTPVPLFLDGFHQIVRLAPRYLYYGSITDFFPAPHHLPPEINFPVYAEQVWYPESAIYKAQLAALGPLLSWESLRESVDVVFPVLHGLGGEDGSLQGLLEQLGIPYVGTGILGSAWGLDKAQQRRWLKAQGFPVLPYAIVPRTWLWENPELLLSLVQETVDFPCVVKHPFQGSTIGVVYCPSAEKLVEACCRASFTWPVEWLPQTPLARLLDLTEGLLLPLLYRDVAGTARELITDWNELRHFLQRCPHAGWLEAWDAPPYLLIEAYRKGEEFSVIVIEPQPGHYVALPPTHIRKSGPLYDYRAKYLSGISSKRTPSPDLPNAEIQKMAERLAARAGLQVYARLDGLVVRETIFFNDPNTTSGMLPASLLFHQAAEVGFSPRDFLTFLIERSLDVPRTGTARLFLRKGRLQLSQRERLSVAPTKRIGVIFGGSSTERHISLESGRNVVEKLSSRYEVVPLFLEVVGAELRLWRLPTRLLFKDNADDVQAALYAPTVPEMVASVRAALSAEAGINLEPEAYAAQRLDWENLAQEISFAFLALHGRPGEDGTIQKKLDALGIPYNGSSAEVCSLLMDKAKTQAFLQAKGFLVPPHYYLHRSEWVADPSRVVQIVGPQLGGYPIIAKPVDEGCSSGVRVIQDSRMLEAYLAAIFRSEEALEPDLQARLAVQPGEDFPRKEEMLLETYLHGPEWVEVTVGVITHTASDGTWRYEVFYPSETVKREGILRLEEKFLTGVGQNITPARIYPDNPEWNAQALEAVRHTVAQLATALGIHGYARVDGFVRRLGQGQVEFWTLEVNALPGLTPATVFFHQGLLAGYTPGELLAHIISEGYRRPRR
ncbi:MAG: D-alanine--D-alanine ligase [Bacteroidia bacterium]|nr:D-alanine--D-alanine ligase [Bacteroidia bacterium]MDW8088314.1 D-alanine--D-alanine ligase [Bacteroidia bacterium]